MKAQLVEYQKAFEACDAETTEKILEENVCLFVCLFSTSHISQPDGQTSLFTVEGSTILKYYNITVLGEMCSWL